MRSGVPALLGRRRLEPIVRFEPDSAGIIVVVVVVFIVIVLILVIICTFFYSIIVLDFFLILFRVSPDYRD